MGKMVKIWKFGKMGENSDKNGEKLMQKWGKSGQKIVIKYGNK